MFRSSRRSKSSKTKKSVFRIIRHGSQCKLHELLTIKQLIAIKNCFEKCPRRSMSKRIFRKTLLEIGFLTLTDEAFDQLCKKVKYSSTSTDVCWAEFLTHLRVGLDSENLEHLSCRLEVPIFGSPKEFKSCHRVPIDKILFMPHLQGRTINHLYGSYVTCSRDGLINYWSMDLEKERTVFSKSTHLTSQQTWITDIVALPDVNVICTSSTERDLRFYDTSAQKFELRVIITHLDDMVTAMYYTFYEDADEYSKLIVGTSGGKVELIFIDSRNRGPFKSQPKLPLRTCPHFLMLKGAIEGMSAIQIPTGHTDWVRQVSYYENVNCVISISSCSTVSMQVYGPKREKDSTSYKFQVTKGFSCFAVADTSHMIITGGPDFLIRLWNPFVPLRTISTLRGHHACIVSITLQDDNRILVTLDKAKCIKVWDVSEQICLQNYFELPASLGERTTLCTYYNPYSRQLFVASQKITYIHIYPLLNGDYTDGVSHQKEISVILYNNLFKSIVTCGFDSIVIMWNPWKGKRSQFIRNAHTKESYGQVIPVEITAAAFDPSQQFLITGASDGTLKIWNFVVKTCIRHMAIEKDCEIYSIIWIKCRILVMGENRKVAEFYDNEEVGACISKTWVQRHQDDILCSAMFQPQVLVTASYNGELVFWRLETGQPFSIYNVLHPYERITQYENLIIKGKIMKRPPRMTLRYKRSTIFKKAKKKLNTRSSSAHVSRISVNALVCLTARPVHAKIGTLLAALENGMIQMWSIHTGGGYITQFKAVHNVRDYVVSMCTDKENKYLFTGHMAGYIKTWHLVNFGVPKARHEYICKPLLRLQFPFMWKDVINGRAKRAHGNKLPTLLNSFRAHLKPVTGIVYIDEVKILFSCSSDQSARVWTLGGRYMGTLGSFKPWTDIDPDTSLFDDTREYPLPADIKRSASFTTYRVMNGGSFEKKPSKKRQLLYDQRLAGIHRIYGRRVCLDSILGKNYKLPERGFTHFDILLDNSLPEVPIYSTMVLQQSEKIKRIPTPDLIKTIRSQKMAMATICSSLKKSNESQLLIL